MDAQDIRNLQEAYLAVYQELDEEQRPLPVDKMKGQMFAHRVRSNDTKNFSKSMRYHTRANRIDDTLSGKRKPQVSRGKQAQKEKENSRFPNRLRRADGQGIRESYDYYDIILSHLLDEGYAETPEAAEAIMVNMSEDWRESIVEEFEELDEEERPIYSRGGEQRRTQTALKVLGKHATPRDKKKLHNIPKGGTTISDRDPEGKRLFTGDQDRGKGSKAARRAGKEVKDSRIAVSDS